MVWCFTDICKKATSLEVASGEALWKDISFDLEVDKDICLETKNWDKIYRKSITSVSKLNTLNVTLWRFILQFMGVTCEYK